MATYQNYRLNYSWLFILFGVIAFSQALAQKPAAPKPKLWIGAAIPFKTEDALRQAVFDTAKSQLHVREKTNRNDHRDIAKYNQAILLPKNAFYCASGLYWCHLANGVRLPIAAPGAVFSWFSDPQKIIYRRSTRGNQRIGRKPQLMDGVSLFTSHVEGYASKNWDPDAEYIQTIGFNTTGGKGTVGGVYLVRRRLRDVKLMVNHITPYFESIKALKNAK
ncbi:hypothetical protein [Siphonobacter sp. SORGH_AS_1065]|uniref:hypothetical protein n=1 Tax=Siphonobacter sp. SORGH_AS_1065 TaxID=3041795 RepID=UPI002782231E|nr:hypothetical protein [Siphonobacter sp. SORGH_AS_1065]MDQ1088991.1 hypothetical protein [Siphonobacter sp. SORGH_AS_1065]